MPLWSCLQVLRIEPQSREALPLISVKSYWPPAVRSPVGLYEGCACLCMKPQDGPGDDKDNN